MINALKSQIFVVYRVADMFYCSILLKPILYEVFSFSKNCGRLIALIILYSLFNISAVFSQSKSPSWTRTIISDNSSVINYQLTVETSFCLNSSNECVQKLTEKAIANSAKLETVTTRIKYIEKRLELAEDRIESISRRKWVNYISTNPVEIIQHIFGGGGIQRDNISISSLEIRTTDLLAAKAELERQQETVKGELGDRIFQLLLDYEAAQRRHKLLTSQLQTLEQQQKVARISYRRGRGSTSQMLEMEGKRDRLAEKIFEVETKRDESERKLKLLVGYQEK